MEFVSLILNATLAVLGAALSTVVILFWIGVGLLAIAFVVFLFRRRSFDVPSAADPVAAIREALRRGEFDAEIGRAQQRNLRRRNLQ